MKIVSLRTCAVLSVLALWSLGCGDDTLTGAGTPPDAGGGRCTDDSQCPPRHICNVAIGVCFSVDECGPDLPCDDGKVCEPNADGHLRCVFDRCDDDSECTDLMCTMDEVPRCVAGRCICGTPCQGGCPSSQGCCIPEDRCYDLPPQCMGLTCPLGEFLSVTSTGAWDTGMCMVTGEVCECTKLPNLEEGIIGRFSAMAHDGNGVVLSAYNDGTENMDGTIKRAYGDLMFGRREADGTITWEFVDGVPTSSASIEGALDGPRSGQGALGDDVGVYTDIAVDSTGRPHIVYHDRTHGDLKYAVGRSTGWSIHTIASNGEAGLYGSIVIGTDDRPKIAFLTVKADEGTSRVSRLRVGLATTETPTAAAHWVLRDLESVPLTGLPCSERCRTGEVCRASDLSCIVPDAADQCSPRCSGDTACISGRCQTIDPLPPFTDLPQTRGLWPSIQVTTARDVLVAYYDALEGSLKIAQVAGPDPATGAISVTTLAGGGMNSPDVGRYPSLFVTLNGDIHLAYHHVGRNALEYQQLNMGLTTLLTETVEADTSTTPRFGTLGADPALVVDARGTVRVAYQDGETGALRYARRTGADDWNVITLRGDEMPSTGSYGFYTDQTLDPALANPLISTFRYLLQGPPGNGLEIISPP